MKKILLLLFFSSLLNLRGIYAQSFFQDFDGDDTLPYMQTINVVLDTSSQNIWQTGAPHKTYFDSAYSRPNALVTDTSLPYPVNNTSMFYFSIPLNYYYYGGFTVQWVQKIDMDSAQDGGIVEISIDSGHTWQNAFSSSIMYNYYGFDPSNVDTLPDGQVGFSGTDSIWRDVWLCVNLYSVHTLDSLRFRFTFKSDSVNSNREGWMIDNLAAHIELVHPIMAVNKDADLLVYPEVTYGPINIKSKSKQEGFKIETAELITETGQLVAHYNIGPGDSNIDISNNAGGWYFLRVTANTVTKTYSVWLSKN
jgi:hypothetical protein